MSKNKNVIIKKNFDLQKIVKKAPSTVALIMNRMSAHVNKSIQNNLNAGKDYNNKSFTPLKQSTVKLKGHSKPLINRGSSKQANSLRRTQRKLATKNNLSTQIIMTGTVGNQSKVIGSNNKTYSVKRQNAGYKHGAIHNIGYTTAPNSMIPNKRVPAREWFGVSKDMQKGGKKFNKFLDEIITRFKKSGHLGKLKRTK